MVPVRLGRKVWCHSSQLATSAVLASANPATKRNRKRGNVIHHARSHVSPRAPYPRKWPDLRMEW